MSAHYLSESCYRRSCLPLRIVNVPSVGGGLLGGQPPIGIVPRTEGARFFATVPLTSDRELYVSVFVVGFPALLAERGKVNSVGLVDVHVHPWADRSNRSGNASLLSGHWLEITGETPDREEDDDSEVTPLSGHKIGGEPYLVARKDILTEQTAKLITEGYSVVAQFGFPSPFDARVSGNWPFGDGVFWLMGRQSLSHTDWCWYWEMGGAATED